MGKTLHHTACWLSNYLVLDKVSESVGKLDPSKHLPRKLLPLRKWTKSELQKDFEIPLKNYFKKIILLFSLLKERVIKGNNFLHTILTGNA